MGAAARRSRDAGGRLSLRISGAEAAKLRALALDGEGNIVEPPLQTATATPEAEMILPLGAYIVEAVSADGRFASAPVDVSSGAGAALELSFDAPPEPHEGGSDERR